MFIKLRIFIAKLICKILWLDPCILQSYDTDDIIDQLNKSMSEKVGIKDFNIPLFWEGKKGHREHLEIE